MDPMDVSFRPLRSDDLPLMHRWINTPHVREWWEPLPTLAEVSARYAARIESREPTRSFIIECDHEPIGYIQTYRIADYPAYATQVQPDPGAAGVDLFIGEASRVGRGTGSRALREFVSSVVFADEAIDQCVIGPEPSNHRAIRSYRKAGFSYWKTIEVPGEHAPEYLMRVLRSDFIAR
jgi:RimJ/RimL family protein N-acetyltransferase